MPNTSFIPNKSLSGMYKHIWKIKQIYKHIIIYLGMSLSMDTNPCTITYLRSFMATKYVMLFFKV
jgi:hypothetical protein